MARKIALRLGKSYGEKIIQLVKRHKLLDEDFKIKHDEKFIFIALKENPSRELLNNIEKICKVEIESASFEKRVDKPLTLTDLLKERMAPDILARLPKSIDIIGDIAVIEISPEIMKYKQEIGEALLKINKNISVLYTK